MGQRSQIYIRYKNKKNIVAVHLQWNYGYYMINRTYQLLDFIKKNIQSNYSNFKEEHFDISNGDRREDLNILHTLIQLNTTIGSYVAGVDLVKEEYEWMWGRTDSEPKELADLKDTFIIEPCRQDNNNGILVIDIQEDGTIKYGLAGGYEEIEGMKFNDDFKMINAKTYFELSEKNYSGEYEEYKLINKDKELYEKVMDQIDFIDSNFTLLTDEEYHEIFSNEYSFKENLKIEDYEKFIPF